MIDYIVPELKQNPHDWDTWLFYSDLLQGQGNPLGELIALEHRLFFSSGPLVGSDHSALMEAREKARNGVKEDLKKKGVSHVLDWYHGLPRDVDFNGNNEQKSELVKWNPFIRCIGTIQGSYGDFSQLVPGTRRHVDELWNDRLVNPELRDKCFYTADGAIYFMRDGKPYFAFTRERSNPAFKNLNEACKQLQDNVNYTVSEEDLESALADPETELFELSKLNGNNSFFTELSTKNPKLDSLSEDGRRLIHRVYGKDNFDEVMSMLAKRWSITRTYVLNPDYVREHASAGAFGRASWLGSNSFLASDCGINLHYRLRGVVQSEPAGES
ncbi:MAG: hypothetical protein Q8Q01_00720 [archaeon]|nr:hypothetical protein [archaeon]